MGQVWSIRLAVPVDTLTVIEELFPYLWWNLPFSINHNTYYDVAQKRRSANCV